MSTSAHRIRVPGWPECNHGARTLSSPFMEIKFWGVRGSTPTPQPENMRYGGNTACVEVRVDDTLYIFDCGTGFRNLGKHLTSGPGPVEAHVFISHFHWDHIQGIPFFTPLYESHDSRF